MLSGVSIAEPGDDPERARLEKEHSLLSEAQAIESERGSFATAIVRPLWDLGLLYLESDRCNEAVIVLDRAVKVLRAAEGLFSPTQLELLDPLEECYLALDLQRDFQRVQEYRVLVAERTFGKNDPAILPMLMTAAKWYEEGGYYVSARQLHARAAQIVRAAASPTSGDNDPRAAEALRGIARAYRLEYVYGLHPIDDETSRGSPHRSRAKLDGTFTQLDRAGEDALKRAVKILEQHPDTNRNALIDTLIELGDWYQMGEMRRDAVRIYRQAWTTWNAESDLRAPLFAQPEPILYRTTMGIALRRSPADRSGFQQYWADLDYTIDREGRVLDVKVGQTNAPKHLQWDLVNSLARTRYRPRFVDGAPADTHHVGHRQTMWVERRRPFRLNP